MTCEMSDALDEVKLLAHQIAPVKYGGITRDRLVIIAIGPAMHFSDLVTQFATLLDTQSRRFLISEHELHLCKPWHSECPECHFTRSCH